MRTYGHDGENVVFALPTWESVVLYALDRVRWIW